MSLKEKIIEMKKIILPLIVILFLTSSCLNRRIDGNGVITTEQRDVDQFNSVITDGVFNVYLSQGRTHEVQVETDENLQGIVKIRTVNNHLYVDLAENTKFESTKMNIYITSPTYEKIDCDGVVNINSTGTIVTPNLKIENDGVGNINLDVICESLSINSDGVGNTTLNGESENLTIRNSGVGDVDAYDHISMIVNIVNSGVGNSEVYVTEELDVTISGVGNVYYKGNPDYVHSNISGVGKLKKR